jgi:hypothetical protein
MNDELEDMKQIWQQTPPAAATTLDAAQIHALLASRSKSAFAKLRQNLLLEAVLAVFLEVFLLKRAFSAPDVGTSIAIAQVAVVLLPCFYFYYLGFRDLQKGVNLGNNLRDTLRASVAFWRRALKIYFWGGVLLFPVVILAALQYKMEAQGASLEGGLPLLAKVLGGTLFAAVIVWFLIRATYGAQVRKMEACLRELEAREG